MLLTKSSRYGRDDGENLLQFFADVKQKSDQEESKVMASKLILMRDSLKKRAEILRQLISAEGSSFPTISEINNECKFQAKARNSDLGIESFLNSLTSQVFKYTHGLQLTSRQSSKIVYEFTSNLKGQISNDVYQITLNSGHRDFTLVNAFLPNSLSLEPVFHDYEKAQKASWIVNAVIPINALANDHLPKMDDFIRATKTSLEAYLSRFDQVVSLPDTFTNGEIEAIDYNFDLTEVKIDIAIGESEGELSKDPVVLQIALTYDHGEDRPRSESLKIKIQGKGKDNFDNQAITQLKNQCRVFYACTISDAIKLAFA